MHIKSVRVQEFGTIGDLEVGLSKNLNIISGPNEAGKSTLMQAVWFALTRRSTSQAQEIRDVVPNGGGTPSVEVRLSADGTTYHLEKVFNGQSGHASLRVESPDGTIENYSDEEADEVIREALGFGEASGRKGVPDHFGFWPAVWVRQEDRQIDPGEHLTNEGDPESISSVLAQIGGDVMAGAGAEVVERAKEEYDRFYTGSGKLTTRSGAPLHEAMENRDDAEERHRELKDRREEYEEDLHQHERLQSEIDRIEEQLPELEKKAEEAIAEFEQAEEIRGELETAQTNLEAAESEVGRLQDRLDRRAELRGEIEELEEELEQKREEVAEKKDVLNARQESRDELVQAEREAESRRDGLKEKERWFRAHLDVLRAEERLASIEERSEKLEVLTDRRDELAGEIAGISVEEDDIGRLEELKGDRDEARTRLESAAAQLSFRAAGDVNFRIEGKKLVLSEGEEETRRIDEPTAVDVEDLLEIRIEPGGKDLASVREEARDTEERYEEALSGLGVGSISEARSRLQRKNRLETELSSVKGQIEELMPEEEGDLGEAEARAESVLEGAKEKRASHSEPGDPPREESKVRRLLEDIEDDLSRANEALEEAREAKTEYDEETQRLKQDFREVETRVEGIEKSLETAKQDLEDRREEHGSDEEIRGALGEKEEIRNSRKEEVKDLQSELGKLDPEQIEEKKRQAEDALETTREEKTGLKSKLDKVRGRLESDDLRGLHGRLEEAKQELEEAQAEVDRLQRQADAAKLLYETLTEKRAEARRKYLAPLREEAEELLSRFFEAETSRVEFGKQFDLKKISRSSDGSFEFDQLSMGAKQQLSVLVRLAMARLIARERPHPVFLDDVLSDTDPDRFEAIGTILRSVARDMQIILTTCHHDRHRRLGVQAKRMDTLRG